MPSSRRRSSNAILVPLADVAQQQSVLIRGISAYPARQVQQSSPIHSTSSLFVDAYLVAVALIKPQDHGIEHAVLARQDVARMLADCDRVALAE